MILREHGARLLAGAALGRTRSYRRLFAYLLERSIAGQTPKEIEIAVEVFGKSAAFDVGRDAFVRVYIHKLRQKIDAWYASHPSPDGMRLVIPRGQYRIAPARGAPVEEAGNGELPAPARFAPRLAVLGLLALAAVLAAALWLRGPPAPALPPAAAHALWSKLLDDDLPVVLVLGDYFIFGELDERGDVRRLVRDFAINSKDDFDGYLLHNPAAQDRYANLDLNYLPVGAAYGLQAALPILAGAGKRIELTTMSELRVADVRAKHVVYVGYLSALGSLAEFVFASSALGMGESFDIIVNVDSGARYVSEAGYDRDRGGSYRDYGLLSTFDGPAGNQVVVIAGTRDTGLMHAAQVAADAAALARLDGALAGRAAPDAGGFEALYEVTGSGRTNLDAMLVHAGPLQYRRIWGGE